MFNMWPPQYPPFMPPPSNVKELKALIKLYKAMDDDGKGFLGKKKAEIKKVERNIGEMFLLLTIFFPIIGILYSYVVLWGIKQVLELLQTLPH